MKFRRKLNILAIGVLSGVFSSCADFLDVSDQVAGGLTNIDAVFENVNYTKRWYGQTYNNVFISSEMWFPTWNPTSGNPWIFLSDECYSKYVHNAGYYADWNSTGDPYQRWSSYYQSIRQTNIFLEKAHAIPGEGVESAKITEAEMTWYRANVRFLRAYYYLCLMEVYGPVPIITQSFDMEDELDVARNSLDEVIKFIDSELLLAMEDMHDPDFNDENYFAVPTKGTALAARAKLWMYAASPLFNGGYDEALEVKNLDGKRLFPDKDDSKWQKAVDACKDLIDYAENGHYDLYKVYKTNGTIDAAKSVYEVFQKHNKEIIWAVADTEWGGMNADKFDKNVTPRSERNGTGQLAVYQELVDAFYMKDGLPIKDNGFLPKSNLYTEEGLGTLSGNKVGKMYINREPRFYNTVTFSGMQWHVSKKEVQFYKGGNADFSGAGYYPISGYLLYKRMNRNTHMDSPGTAWVFRPSIVYRLAEFYLLYAEALNEVNPSDPDILKYVNLVRERAGLAALEKLNPAIKGDQTLQREAIRAESRVELCTEGQRYFDIRRWMIAENEVGEGGLNGAFHGMNLAAGKMEYHERTIAFRRTWKRKAYFHGLPYAAMEKSRLLVQNPGW